ncbi:MAG: LytR C-terminal domain-containing protein [Candidatus Roizmanbacteria bacterium]
MLYVFVEPKQIKIVSVKKGILGSVETTWTTFSPAKKISEDGYLVKSDAIAEVLKDAISSLPNKNSETQVVVVLEHSLYSFARIEIPVDIQKHTYNDFIREKLQSIYKKKLAEYHVDFFIAQYDGHTTAFVYAIPQETLRTLTDAAESIKLTGEAIVPEQLAYYTLFEKTVRFDKRENIMYAVYDSDLLKGFFFDTFGPVEDPKPWRVASVETKDLEPKLKEKTEKSALDGFKLNRVILSGSATEKIRQDTFTKNIGVWTNPLKRIVPNFYHEYMAQIHGKSAVDILPILTYDVLLGSYICHTENKSFTFGKIGTSQKTIAYKQTVTSSTSKPMVPQSEQGHSRKSIPFLREAALFLIIFVVVFSGLYFLLQGRTGTGVTLPSFLATASPTTVPTIEPTKTPPTPTPTVEVKRSEIKVRILNGTGVRGQAAGISKLLSKKGYTSVTLGNAANYNYTVSEININTDKMNLLKGTVVEDVKDSVAKPKIGELKSTDTVDVEIILGTDAN